MNIWKKLWYLAIFRKKCYLLICWLFSVTNIEYIFMFHINLLLLTICIYCQNSKWYVNKTCWCKMYVLLYVFAPYIFMNFNIMTYYDNKNGLSRLHLKFDLSVMLQPHFFLNHPYTNASELPRSRNHMTILYWHPQSSLFWAKSVLFIVYL